MNPQCFRPLDALSGLYPVYRNTDTQDVKSVDRLCAFIDPAVTETLLRGTRGTMVALLDAMFALRVSQQFFTFQRSVPASVPFPTARTPWSRHVPHGEHTRRVQLKQCLICLNGGRHGLLSTRCYCHWTRLWTRPLRREECPLGNPINCKFRLAPCKGNFLLHRQHSSLQTRRCSPSTLHYNPHLSCRNQQTVARSLTEDCPR